MDEIMLFTDGSVNTKSKIGYGSYLLVSDPSLPLDSLKKMVKVKKFEKTSSTKLELQTLLWALGDIQISKSLVVYTDSQNIIGLPGRRERFEKNDYYSKNNKRLNNYELYQKFYRATDQLSFKLVKIRGHKKTKQKDSIDKIFTIVDRASRDAMRKCTNMQK
ncbi:MAG: ribonuclease H [Desulfobacterales bacterium]|nr:ribonuclease H [Desulfobacterales bacterium]MCP4161315.1 ribonuclease H [Deltaproteobacteria bacterium]